MSDPGELNRRLTLEAPVETDDGAGGVIRSYSAVAMLWASVVPVAARASVAAGAAGAEVSHRIRVRFRSDLTLRHRLRDGPTLYRIMAMRARDRRYLELDAAERVE